MDHAALGTGLCDMRLNARLRLGVDHGADVGGQLPRVAKAQRVHRAAQHGQQVVGDILLHIEAAQRRAALTGGLEGAFDDGLHRLFRECGAVHDHCVQPAGFRDEGCAGGQVARHRGADFQGGLGGAGKRHARHARIGGERRAHIPCTGQELQRRQRHTGGMQKANRARRNQRGLLRRFGKHRVACGKGGSNLAGEDGQREVPRRDAGKHARRRRRVVGAGGVVAQEIHRLTQFRLGIHLGLACLAGQQGENLAGMRLVEIGGAVERRGAGLGVLLPRGRGGQGGVDIGGAGGGDGADLRAGGGVGRGQRVVRRGRARDQRRGGPEVVAERAARGVEIGQHRQVAQILPARIHPFGQEQVGAGLQVGQGDLVKGIGGHGFGGDGFVHDLVDERAVRAVFQQAPHEIGQQVAMRANRRVDAAAGAVLVFDDVVQRLAHAVQALEFKGVAVVGHMQDGRHGVRVVGGELRIDAVGHRQQLARIGDVGHIRRGLGGEHRKARHAHDLRAFDLGIPIGALDQPHHDLAIEPFGHRIKRVDHRTGAGAIGLHDDAEALPSRKRGLGEDGFNHLKRQRQAVGFLGVDVEAHPRRFRQKRQRA